MDCAAQVADERRQVCGILQVAEIAASG
ncbi:hypothetical protein GGD46_001227 [Rhizobium lusitanum]|uniref:Uncharacterized protein n=1 Tax=Rhizobium lusitanum TaxID=293958 RepID=A0A7X0IQR9_9HYPH|nr:hypothetical protein [Rhizobium lusitanum]